MGDTTLVGIKSVEDLKAYRFSSAAEMGLNTISKVMEADLAAVNASMVDSVSLLAEPVTEQSRIYGTSYRHTMQKVDEHGVPDSKKAQPGQTVSFPLERFAITLGWTNDYFARKSPADLAEDYIAARDGYRYEVIKQIKNAAYKKSNFNHVDELTNGVTLAVKRFLNADGAKIPNGNNGASFVGASHQHYIGMTGSAADVQDVTYLVNHVTEHGHFNGLVLAVSATDAPAIQAMVSGTNGFIPALDGGLITPSPLTQAFGSAAPVMGDNRLIGFWRNSAVQIWIKPWAVTGRFGLFATGASEKPLGYRQPAFAGLQGLRFGTMDERLTIKAQMIEAEFGFGVWNRTAAAFLDIVNQATYTDPTIT